MPSSETPPSDAPPDPPRVSYSGQVTPGPIPFDFAAATAGTLIGVTGVSMQAHAGPLPSPSILAGYRDIDPTFPGRILAMAEANAATERRTAKRAQIFQLAEQIASRLFGAACAVTALLIAAWLANKGHDTVADIIAGTTVVGITVALITGRPRSNSAGPNRSE